VRIWDAGTYRLEKWHDDGIAVTLHGRDAGGLGGAPVAVTLIAAALDGDPDNWLLHRRRNG
jgi:bifunctional non-homologous end joining protein LigD